MNGLRCICSFFRSLENSFLLNIVSSSSRFDVRSSKRFRPRRPDSTCHTNLYSTLSIWDCVRGKRRRRFGFQKSHYLNRLYTVQFTNPAPSQIHIARSTYSKVTRSRIWRARQTTKTKSSQNAKKIRKSMLSMS